MLTHGGGLPRDLSPRSVKRQTHHTALPGVLLPFMRAPDGLGSKGIRERLPPLAGAC